MILFNDFINYFKLLIYVMENVDRIGQEVVQN